MLLHNFFDLFQLFSGKPVVIGQLDLRFKPELCFAFTAYYMDMYAGLFAGEEKEAIRADS